MIEHRTLSCPARFAGYAKENPIHPQRLAGTLDLEAEDGWRLLSYDWSSWTKALLVREVEPVIEEFFSPDAEDPRYRALSGRRITSKRHLPEDLRDASGSGPMYEVTVDGYDYRLQVFADEIKVSGPESPAANESSLRATLIDAARDLLGGSPDASGGEYTRGMVELIVNSTCADTEDADHVRGEVEQALPGTPEDPALTEARLRVDRWVRFDRINRPEVSEADWLGISYGGENRIITRADLALLAGVDQ